MTKQDQVTLRDIYDAVDQLRQDIGVNYVTKAEFWPIKSIVYGGASIVLLGVFGFLVNLAIKK